MALIALAIVISVLVGAAGVTLPFFGSVVDNIMAIVKNLGSNGLVGLITIGIVVWLFSGRSAA